MVRRGVCRNGVTAAFRAASAVVAVTAAAIAAVPAAVTAAARAVVAIGEAAAAAAPAAITAAAATVSVTATSKFMWDGKKMSSDGLCERKTCRAW